MADISDLLGKTLVKIEKEKYQVVFYCSDGKSYKMFHYDACCEEVYLQDVIGNIDNLLNSTILMAEKVTSDSDVVSVEGLGSLSGHESFTWTFYKLATIKGYVTLRWYGHSNGYYSEEVSFEAIQNESSH